MSDDARVAVLIDCDNISWKLAKAIFAETTTHGTLSIKRGYGDWTSTYLSGWKSILPIHAIQPVQQFAHVAGKNATDSALIIDAMDLLYAGNMDAFCIISSDSDFTRLAMRLRESGKAVYGIGGKKTPQAFTKACDRFTYLEVVVGAPLSKIEDLGDAEESSGGLPAAETSPASESPHVVETPTTASQPNSTPSDTKPFFPAIRELLEPAIQATTKETGWSPLSTVGWYLVNSNPSFDSRNYGYAKLGPLVRDLEWVEAKEIPDAGGTSHLWIRLLDSDAHPAGRN